MRQNNMEFVNGGGIVATGNDTVIGKRPGLAAVPAGKDNARQRHFPALLQGPEDIRRIAGRGDAEKNIVLAHLAGDLARKYLLISVIIPDRGKNGAVHRERE